MSEQHSDHDHTQSFVPLTPGTLVSHYRVVKKIGAGGMGEVYLAEDARLKRNVAVKFLPHGFAGKEDVRARFLREAQAVAKLSHPNIVALYDVSEFGGRPFFVMEHVEGQELHHFCHEEPLPFETVLDYAIQICQGIGEAHRAGIVHRDIKSTNIIVDKKGRVRLLDFGLASVAGDDRLTKTGSTLGTIAYMSPEQVSGREPDHRSDLFSFGVVLYELLAGRTPFRRDNEGSTLRAIMQEAPEPLSRYKGGLPAKLQDIMDKLLEKDRELRYQSAEGVIADLKRLVYDSQPTGSRAFPVPPAPPRTLPWLPIGLGAAAVTIVGVLTLLFLRPATPPASPEQAVPMIAVLPFENLGNPDDEYFADGMTEEITSRLAGINGLGVISRTSSMQYKGSGKTLKQIGHELSVDYVLEGTVRWAKVGGQSRVRITPQLVRVSDDRHIWADNYEREIMEVFAVQEDIATKIVDQLGLTLVASDKAELAARPTDNPVAYEYYLKGMARLRIADWRDPIDLRRMVANLDSAVLHDPTFALAYAARSRAYSILTFESPTDSLKKIARESFEKALELAPDDPQGRIAAGVYYNLVETDYERAFEEFRMAQSEVHSDASLLADMGLVQMRQGNLQDALDSYRRAADLDPLNPNVHIFRAVCQHFARLYDESEQSSNRAIALNQANPQWYMEKLMMLISRDGNFNAIRAMIAEGLAHCDTLEFLTTMWASSRYMNGVSLDSLLAGTGVTPAELISRNRDMPGEGVPAEIRYGMLALGYHDLDDSARAFAFFDSSRAAITASLKTYPKDFDRVAALGFTLSYMGRCDEAVEIGLRGKELMSIKACHW